MAQNKHEQSHKQNVTELDSGATLSDPVCGMNVTEESPHHLAHNGKSFFFCSAKCKHSFESDPEKFTGPQRKKKLPKRWSPAQSIPVRCTLKFNRMGPEAAPSVAWRSSRSCPPWTTTIQN